jgi:hypothetical protein
MATNQACTNVANKGILAGRRVLSVPAWPVLALVAAVSRLPFVHATPINWDSVQFTLALDQFDLHSHQPHPPGYILYVLVGRIANLAVGNPGLSLSLLSVLATTLALPLFYRLVMRVFDDVVLAWGASLILAASPLAMYYGSVGLTYMPEMLLSILVAALAWRVKIARAGELTLLAALLALSLGVAGGVRQTSLPILLPLCVWALWKAGRRAWVVFALMLAAVCALWFVPLVVLSGGLGAYLHENALLAGAVVSRTSVVDAGLSGLLYNLTFEGLALAIGLGLGLITLALWALRLVKFSLSRPARAFLLLWALPSLLFYSVSHVGQFGYMLVLVPPLAILSAIGARVLAMMITGRREQRDTGDDGAGAGLALCGAIALFSLSYFLLAPGPITASVVEGNDAHWRAVQTALRGDDPASTVLVMGIEWDGPFRAAGYLLPQYRSYGVDTNDQGDLGWLYSAYRGKSDYSLPTPEGQPSLQLPPNTRKMVALDPISAQRFAPTGTLDCIKLSDGSTLYTITPDDGRAIVSLDIDCSQIEAHALDMPAR